MSYAAFLASVPRDSVAAFRNATGTKGDGDAGSPGEGGRAGGVTTPALVASRVEQCPHDLTAVDIQPLGTVLAEAIDIGQPLRNDGWHPLRAPVVVDPETVMARSMKLEAAWVEAEPELGGMMADVLGPDIDRVRSLYAHASARGESVVSYLSAPDDADKAARTLLPTVVIA